MDFYDLIETPKETIEKILEQKDLHYRSYPIVKSNGKQRWIDAPDEELKAIQANILYLFLYLFTTHHAAMGFRIGIGVADGAKVHLPNNTLLCMDLSNFFPSIKKERVLTLVNHLLRRLEKRLWKFTYTAEDAEYLTEILVCKGRVPQGAPTSPALANLIAIMLDTKLSQLAEHNGLTYTRYADDLSFSHPDSTYDIYERIPEIIDIIREERFKVNYKKTRVTRPHKRMVVTGVVVNDKLSVPKYQWRNFRARLHNLSRDKVTISAEEYQQLRGYVEWIRSLNPHRGEQFLKSLSKISLVST